MKRPVLGLPSLRLICRQCRRQLLSRAFEKRLLTTTTRNRADSDSTISDLKSLSKIFAQPNRQSPLGSSASTISNDRFQSFPQSSLDSGFIKGWRPPPLPHHLHIYATKHNTHITLTDGMRQPIISVSAGNIGFRKAARGTYDAGYQLGSYVMGRIQQQGLMKDIHNVEVVLRDFGPGREAVTKILLGSEGKNIRGRIIRVMDATRLKFGGTRSKKPRRLG